MIVILASGIALRKKPVDRGPRPCSHSLLYMNSKETDGKLLWLEIRLVP